MIVISVLLFVWKIESGKSASSCDPTHSQNYFVFQSQSLAWHVFGMYECPAAIKYMGLRLGGLKKSASEPPLEHSGIEEALG